MTTTADEPARPGAPAESGRDRSDVTRRPSTNSRCSAAGLIFLTGLAVFFVYLSHRPLWHTDLWGHLAYGRRIVELRAIPATEPLMPLCHGVPFVDFSWLSELIGYAAERAAGPEALQFLYAASVTACVGLLAWCTWRKTGRLWAAALAATIYIWVDWQQLAIMRPQLAGCVCFLVLWAFRRKLLVSRWQFVAVPVLFAAWANLHGSFLIGLALLAALLCGRAVDLVRRTGSLRAVLDDRELRLTAVALVLALAAVLVNPYGWRIYPAAWQLSTNANLADLIEWQPLALWMGQAWAALAVAVALLGLWVLTPRRISTTELLLVLGLGAATLATSRMILWWGPIAAYYTSVHAAALARRWRRAELAGPLSANPSLGRPIAARLSSRTIPPGVIVAVVLIAFALTPLVDASLLHVTHPNSRSLLSAETPIEATEYLQAYPPHGQVFNSMEWGDYLLWAGPPGLEVYAASHVHLLPRTVWQDYIRVVTLDDGWQKILDRYQVNTAIIDGDQHSALAEALRADPDWHVVYEDTVAAILSRRRPL
jgi:hypothetical protein